MRIAAIAALFAASSAHAFHAGNTFDKPAGAGGGGSIFYTGAPLEHGWDCTNCHRDAPGKIRINLAFDPPLPTDRRYTPGRQYTVTVAMLDEWLGHQATRSDFNGVAVSIADGNGQPAGKIDSSPSDFYGGGPATVVTAGQALHLTSWTFRWTAPDPGAGTATLYVGMVDGNGANSAADSTLTDPFGDDVAIGTLPLDEGTLASRAGPQPQAKLAGAFVLAFGLLLLRRSRARFAKRFGSRKK